MVRVVDGVMDMREMVRWAVGLALGAALMVPAQARDAAALGLIVRLKDAPTHERAQAQALGAGRTQADAEAERVHGVLAAAGLSARRVRPVGRDAQVVDFGRALSVTQAETLAAQLRLRPDVAWVEPNTREPLLAVRTPTDPLFARTATQAGQWWMYTSGGAGAAALAERRQGVPNLQTAWSTSTGSSSAVVAVLDTGITTHGDLAGRVLPGYDFVSEVAVANDGNGRDADPSDPGDWVSDADVFNDPDNFDGCEVSDSTWHGTRIAGMLAARTNSGGYAAGIQWNGRVLPVRVAGKCGASVADIVDGMRWAAGLPVTGVPANSNPARVVNISFGGTGSCSVYVETIADLKAAGVIVVAAAGNQAAGPSRPAKCAGVVGVVALNRDGFKAYYSNFGSALSASGIATVGGDPASGDAGDDLADEGLLTLDDTGLRRPDAAGSAYVAGTSFSAPIAAGVAGLMLAVNPDLSAQQLIDGLRVSSRPHVSSGRFASCSAANNARCDCSVSTCGAGILDADAAVRHAQAVVGEGAGGGNSGGGGGGGAVSPGWLLGLLAAVLVLSWSPARSRRARSPGPARRT